MKDPAHLLAMAGLALICCGEAVLHVAVAQEPPVLAQDLKKLRVPGKVGSVLWTRRTDQYTLQVVFPRSYRMLPKQPPATNPAVQAWLLKADGTLIAAARRTVSMPGQSSGNLPDEVLYSIPLSAGQEAVAVALMIDSDYYIQELKPLGSEKSRTD
jgi:hypothetical protein